MSESTIRRFVRTAMEEQAADMGLFSDERIHSFFAVVKTLVHDCFYSLYDTVMREYSNAAERQHRLHRGLAYIASDANHTLGADEVSRALEEFPTIEHEYERAIVRFAQIMVPHREPGMKVEVPPFSTFLMKLYRRVATSADVKSGRFFNMTYFEKDIFLKDMFRVTMNACVSLRPSTSIVSGASASASIHASGPAGGSTRSESRLVTSALMHAASAASTAPAPSTTSTKSKSGMSSMSMSSAKVLPSDSVSNIHTNNTKPTPASASVRKHSVVAEGSDEESDTDKSSTVTDVTQFSLRKYKKQLEERNRQKARDNDKPANPQPKPFVTASIARSRNEKPKEEKQVDMESKSVSGFFDDLSATGVASDFAGFSTLSRH